LQGVHERFGVSSLRAAAVLRTSAFPAGCDVARVRSGCCGSGALLGAPEAGLVVRDLNWELTLDLRKLLAGINSLWRSLR